jgi:hypothetical protein
LSAGHQWEKDCPRKVFPESAVLERSKVPFRDVS